MNPRTVLNAKGRPFTDPDAARQKAISLTEELGESYVVINIEGGFAVAPKASAQDRSFMNEPTTVHEARAEQNDSEMFTDTMVMIPPRTISERVPMPKSQLAQAHEARKSATKNSEASAAQPNTAAVKPQAADLGEIQLRPSWRYFWKKHVLAVLGFLLTLNPIFTIRFLSLFQLDEQTLQNNFFTGLMPLIRFMGMATTLMAIGYALTGYYSRLYLLRPTTIESNLGIFSRRTVRIEYAHIRSVDVEQSVLDRILKIGRVDMSTANTAGLEVKFIGVSSPMEIQEEVYRRKRLIEKKYQVRSENDE